MIGTVKSYASERGWGFIQSEHDGEIFVHSRGIERSSRQLMHTGAQVSFVIVPSVKGFQAAHVRVIR